MGILDGKAIIVTGAGTGLGRAYARSLGAEGAAVIVIGRQIVNTSETPAKETPSERTVCDQRDSEFSQGLEQTLFRFATEQRVLGLDRCDPMNLMRTTNGVRSGFR